MPSNKSSLIEGYQISCGDFVNEIDQITDMFVWLIAVTLEMAKG